MKKRIPFLLLIVLILASCIKDDFVDDEVEPVIRITNNLESLKNGEDFQFKHIYLNNIGKEENVNVKWSSSDVSILTIDESTGLASSVAEGTVTVTVSYQGASNYTASNTFDIGTETVVLVPQKSGIVNTTSSYALHGSFVIKQIGDDVKLEFESDYSASTGLPGLYIYLSNNPNSSADALEIGAVQVFSGVHSYTIPNEDINKYAYVLYFCKPFNVKVGHGEIQ